MSSVGLIVAVGISLVLIFMYIATTSMNQRENKKLSPIYIPIHDRYGRRKTLPPQEEEESSDPLVGALFILLFLASLLFVLIRLL